MSYLIISVEENVPMVLGNVSTSFIAGSEAQTKDMIVAYTNGNGAALTAGQVLANYTANGISLKVTSSTNQTLVGSGNLRIAIQHISSPTTSNSSHTVTYTTGTITGTVNISYLYRPTTNDIIIEDVDNRGTVYILNSQILARVADLDGSVTHIAFIGDVTGLYISNTPYVAGTWILISDLADNVLNYRATDTDASYTKQIEYKVKDNTNLESIT